MKQKVAYIAGPMSGCPLWNFPMFDACRDWLKEQGIVALSPADMDRQEGFDPETSVPDKAFFEDAMKRDIEAIMVADMIVMLPGWEKSTGATAEYWLARWRHIPVHYWYPAPSEEVKSVGCNLNPITDMTEAMDVFVRRFYEGKESVLRENLKRLSPARQPDEVGWDKPVDLEEWLREKEVGAVDPKADAGSKKCPMHLLPPVALEDTAWVHKFGANRYGPYNWRETGVKLETYVGAIMRHLMEAAKGNWLDPESGKPHIAHIAASCNILLDAEHHGKLEK